MAVSDRARALLQVVGVGHLDSFSMPDLFHFMQDLSKTVGGRLGLQVGQAQKKLKDKTPQSADYKALMQDLGDKQERLQSYRTYREAINKAVHPFNENDELTTCDELEVQLQKGFTKIRALAQQAQIEIALDKGEKILNQIPDIGQGVAHWIKHLNTKMEQLNLAGDEKKWRTESLLPYAYWQVHQTKKTTKKRDKALNEYYQQRVQQAKLRFEQAGPPTQISEQTKEQLVNWAFRQVATFHRASSQVEGRNGYLAFVHHANKGMTEKRQKVLTVVHNFDIRRADGKTPAQRLFNKEFPNLFEFVLDNVGQLPQPRSRKMKYAINN